MHEIPFLLSLFLAVRKCRLLKLFWIHQRRWNANDPFEWQAKGEIFIIFHLFSDKKKLFCLHFFLFSTRKVCLIAIKLIQHFLSATFPGKKSNTLAFSTFFCSQKKPRELLERKQIKHSTTTIWQVRKYANCKFIPPYTFSPFVITFFFWYLSLVSRVSLPFGARECSFL